MTQNELAFLFNHSINFFYLEDDVRVYRQKRGGQKYFGIDDARRYTQEEIEQGAHKPLAEFKRLEDLLDFEYKGKKLKDWIDLLNPAEVTEGL